MLSSMKSMGDQAAGEGEGSRMHALSYPPPSDVRAPRAATDLARVIESEIIPRLMLAGGAIGPERAQAAGRLTPRVLASFVDMTQRSEAHTLLAYVEALIQRGLALEDVYVELLAPTARRLGDGWNDDLISFTDVTIGLGRLQQVVRGLGASHPAHSAAPDARAACFVSAPDEQHTFGLVILEDRFRRAGWRTWLDASARPGDAADAVSQTWFDVFGVSATSDAPPGPIAALIASVRRASRNPDLLVMAGGGMFLADPSLAAAVGADASPAAAAEALSVAENAIKPAAFA